MDQKKIGLFLRELRKAKEFTQEQLADFYQVDIKEIIDGERKSETMNEETRETIVKLAEYTEEEKKVQNYKMRKIIGGIFIGFGAFLAVSALAIFPHDSSWGGYLFSEWRHNSVSGNIPVVM